MNDALTQYGRINSHDLPLGTVLIWNQKTGEIDRFPSIAKSGFVLERTPLTGTEAQISIRGVSETDIAVSTPPLSNLPPLDGKTTVGIKAAVGSETHLQLSQYFLEDYDGPYGLPNDPSTVDWRRQNLSDRLIDPNLIFVFVTSDTSANEARFYSGTPTEAWGNPKPLDNALTLAGNKIIDVSYTGGSSIDRKGSEIPALVKYKYYLLEKDSHGASGYHFRRITSTNIDHDFIAVLRKNSID